MPRSQQSTRWVFTLNNYTAQDEQGAADFLSGEHVRYGIYGREVGQSGTPHLQGFFVVKRQRTLHWLRGRMPRAHLEAARGTSQQARDYCKKDGNFDEYGTFPDQQGRRTDLEEIWQWAEDFEADNGRAPSTPEVARSYPNQLLRYRHLPSVIRARSSQIAIRDPQESELREWQQALEEELEGDADDRSIRFYVDTEGEKGKTWFQQYYLSKYPEETQCLTVAKSQDLAHAICPQKRVIFFNIPRNQMDYISYSLLEQIKDRMVFSPKYDSRMKIFNQNAHVVVFSNETPDYNKMTADRYNVTEL